jgi:hypothetical protein
MRVTVQTRNTERATRNALGPRAKIGALAVPWAFLVAFAALYATFVLPRMSDGHLAAVCLGAFVALVFVAFFFAAITFSRDVLLGRWPE